MKKPVLRLTTLALLLVSSFSSFAQFELGLFVGGNMNHVSLSNNVQVTINSATDFMVGVSPGYRFKEKYKVLADVKVLRKGYKVLDQFVGQSFAQDIGYRNMYLEFAEQFEFRPVNYLGISAGGFAALKLESDARIDDGEWINRPRSNVFSKSEFGLTFGIRGYFHNVTIVALYSHGLSNSARVYLTDDTGNPIGTVKLKNKTIQFGLGYVWSRQKNK